MFSKTYNTVLMHQACIFYVKLWAVIWYEIYCSLLPKGEVVLVTVAINCIYCSEIIDVNKSTVSGSGISLEILLLICFRVSKICR